jgi:hypothetical protein
MPAGSADLRPAWQGAPGPPAVDALYDARRGVYYTKPVLRGWLLLAGNPAQQTARSEQRQDAGVTADLLRTGWGQALLVLARILVVAGGVEAGRRAVRLNFRERFTAEHMSRALATVTRALGAFGSVARAVVFVLTGAFLIKAAVLSRADQAKGPDAVFRSVASSHYGAWLLALLACGLFCYGLYCLVEARYRDLTPGQ